MEKYIPEGICPYEISFKIEGDRVKNVNFCGGCDGNAKGISSLVEGMSIEEVIEKLSGITCGRKDSSCPDQLAKALKKTTAKENEEK